MRWIFLLLVALNIFYFVWTQQQAPSLARDVAPFTLPDGAKRNIHLVSEREGMQSAQASAVSGSEICLYLGGFENENDASLLEQRLISLDIPAKQTVVSSESSKDYWVYLPPFGSREAALRQFRELQARGLDSYLITQGDLANGVSLGIFSSHDSAVSLLERIRSLGYGAELRELIRERHDYWVYVLPGELGLVGDKLLEQLMQDFPGFRHRMIPCTASLAKR